MCIKKLEKEIDSQNIFNHSIEEIITYVKYKI